MYGVNQLKAILHLKMSKAEYAERLGISVPEVEALLEQISKEKRESKTAENETIRKVDVERGTIESKVISKFEPRDHKKLAELHQIDTTNYTIQNYWTKQLASGKFISSVFCKRKMEPNFNLEEFEDFLNKFQSNYIPVSFNPPTDSLKDSIIAELSLSDFHLAKRTIDSTGNDPGERRKRFVSVVRDLLTKASKNYDLSMIIFPISNDFFHSDTYHNTTTNGTSLDTIMSYAEEYDLGFSILVDSISIMLAYAPVVEVIFVPGNHDRSKSYYLAHALEVYFKDESRVKIDRKDTPVKGVKAGSTFIGYHHGDCRIDELPLLFATHPQYGKCFGRAKYREIHTGDKHHYMAKELKGVRIQQMPSLSGIDRWHRDNNFVHSIRAALLLGYDSLLGKVLELETRI